MVFRGFVAAFGQCKIPNPAPPPTRRRAQGVQQVNLLAYSSLAVGRQTLFLMQYVQNSAAHLLTHTSRREHITPVLFGLHWLPIRQHINFKVLVLTYQAIHAAGPSYLTELITVKCPVRDLRSSGTISLIEPKPRLNTVGGCAFSRAAPKLWNELPDTIRKAESITAFKSQLKTHLFKQKYKDYC